MDILNLDLANWTAGEVLNIDTVGELPVYAIESTVGNQPPRTEEYCKSYVEALKSLRWFNSEHNDAQHPLINYEIVRINYRTYFDNIDPYTNRDYYSHQNDYPAAVEKRAATTRWANGQILDI